MRIPFEYPAAEPTFFDATNPNVIRHKASVIPICLDQEPYEITLEARGYSFHMIFGSQINGNFLCIPNWQFGCELAEYTDKSWNIESILHNNSCLEYEDASAIVWALSLISDYIYS